MTEPIASAAAGAVVAAAGAGILATFGLEPGPLFWSLVGASIGMSFAGPTTRVRATIVFAAASLSCSLFGAWLAQRYLGGEPLSRNAFACALAIGFHPLLNAAVMEVPLFFAGLRRRWFGAGSQP